MKLLSQNFEHDGKIPSKYTCDGDNINPQLGISDVPLGAKSLVLIMDDPDVPKNLKPDGMWDHWIIFNMSPSLFNINEGEEPEGVHGIGTGGNTDYFGPCPPDREHRYFFKVYALDIILNCPEKANKTEIEDAMQEHILDQAELMGRYERG